MGTIALEEYELMKDSKYRVYVSAVDKALKNFEYTSEWADLISALGKLNKVLISHTKFPVIPRRIKISKRLAQCMHPALPSGVHLKALETYDIIFKCMGTSRLSHELFIYSAGLFPLLGHAAMNVRPSLLTVYETHFVPLGERLGPGLSGFLSGVLPGLEDGSDHYDRTNALLERVCEGVGAARFYGCLWDCMRCNAAVRLPAISFALAHYDRRKSTEDQLHVMGTDVDCMVAGLCACVRDSSVLVQRSALDLLLCGFPMHNSHLLRADTVRLVTAALATVLRRDMSLNRRLYAWLLGSEVNTLLLGSEHPLVKRSRSSDSLAPAHSTAPPPPTYFDTYSRDMLVQAVKSVLSDACGESPPDLRPYRLLVSLLDKVDVGPPILDDILYEVFRLLYLCCEGSSKPSELLKSANLLFASLEPRYMWHYTGQLVANACRNASAADDADGTPLVRPVASGEPDVIEVCTLAQFLLDTAVGAVETSWETPSEHLPALFLTCVTLLTERCATLAPNQAAGALALCAKILTRVQPATTTPAPPEESEKEAAAEQQGPSQSHDHTILEQCLRQYERFYVSFVRQTRARVGDCRDASQLLAALRVKSSRASADERQRQLEALLVAVIRDNGDAASAVTSDEVGRLASEEAVAGAGTAGASGEEWSDAMRIASRLLVDLSTLQTFFRAPAATQPPEPQPYESGDAEAVLPEWLRVLVVCACWMHSAPSLQMIAISTVLDLVTLCHTAQSLVAGQGGDHQGQQQTAAAVTTVLIRPLLTPTHLHHLQTHTNVFQVMAHRLWCRLSSASASERVRSVELLHQMQSALGPASDVTEDCVGRALAAPTSAARLDAFRTFSTLWHVGREINARLGHSLRLTDTFYKSMLKMVDCLESGGGEWEREEGAALRVEAEGWLLHSLLRGDLGRLLDPLLTLLLEPATARVSVLHVRVQDDSQTDSASASASQAQCSVDEQQRRVYAISSVDGNVIYHVAAADPAAPHPPPKRARRVSAVTSIARRGAADKCVTEKRARTGGSGEDDADDAYRAHSSNLNLLQNISVFVNPFSRNGGHQQSTVDINTDFDDYYEDKDSNGKATLDKSKSNSSDGGRERGLGGEVGKKKKKAAVHRNNSLDRERTAKSSLDLLSDTIFARVSDGEGLMVRSASLPGRAEAEVADESTSAEDYFGGARSDEGRGVVDLLMSDLLDRVAATSASASASDDNVSTRESGSSDGSGGGGGVAGSGGTPGVARRQLQYRASVTSGVTPVDPLHSHLLLYCGVYDARRALYALRSLRNVLTTNPRAFLCSAAATALVSRSPLLKLLARQRKSVFGRGFQGELDASSTKSCMYLEAVVTTALYYVRGVYPNLGQAGLTPAEIHANRQVQVSAAELLAVACYELTAVVRDSGRGLACYLADVMARVKVQRITLHCLLASAPHPRSHSHSSFTHDVLAFNETRSDDHRSLATQADAFQVQLLRLVLSLIMLEHEVNERKGDGTETEPKTKQEEGSGRGGGELRYASSKPLPQQPMLLAAVLRALEATGDAARTHAHWTALVTCALPYLGSALTRVVSAVVRQLCANVERLATAYDSPPPPDDQHHQAAAGGFPADYAVTQVEALTVLCHYCLLDSAAPFATHPLSPHSSPQSTPAQIFNSLVHVFMPSPLVQNNSNSNGRGGGGGADPQCGARKAVLGSLPRVVASVAVLWHALTRHKDREQCDNCEAGSARVVRQQLLEFLSPIAVAHPASFLGALAVVWRERHDPTTAADDLGHSASTASDGQVVLVQLLSAIKTLPVDTLVTTLHQVVKQPDRQVDSQTAMSVEVSALELFAHYTPLVAVASLGESWPALAALLREGPSLSPPAQFLLLAVLSQFVSRASALTDRKRDDKDKRDLQDITAKLVESCSQIAGANLEQTTWLRRNLAVKGADDQPPASPAPSPADATVQQHDDELESEPAVNGQENVTSYDVTSPKKSKSKSKLKKVTRKIRQDAERLQIGALHQWFSRSFVHDGSGSPSPPPQTDPGVSAAHYSVAALSTLAALVAPLLDVSHGSQDKERVVALLTSLMGNVTPYLRNHTQRNAASYLASAQLLASLSGFQYTRKAWRKDALDLLLDPQLFAMDARALACWRQITDNLMSQDPATFRDLVARLCGLGQGNSLSLFGSREQEYEQRAQLLKRLAFVILCSEKDQFHKHTPDIQERLAESLRLPGGAVPAVQAQVFLCFRVLLLRMSPHHVTSLWPLIVSEMVQVMLHMEHDLSTDTDEFRRNNSSHIRLLSALDWSWVVNSSNGLQSSGHPHHLQLQLAAAKLLHLAVRLPADALPQFQMYRWAFVGPASADSGADFVPHVARIARLMDAKFGSGPAPSATAPLLPSTVRVLRDLHPFFTALSSGVDPHSAPPTLRQLEADVELDFLEPMPAR